MCLCSVRRFLLPRVLILFLLLHPLHPLFLSSSCVLSCVAWVRQSRLSISSVGSILIENNFPGSERRRAGLADSLAAQSQISRNGRERRMASEMCARAQGGRANVCVCSPDSRAKPRGANCLRQMFNRCAFIGAGEVLKEAVDNVTLRIISVIWSFPISIRMINYSSKGHGRR